MLNCYGVASTANIGADCALIIVMFLLTLVTLATAVWLLAKFINEEKGRNTVKYAAIVVAAGVVIRLLCAVLSVVTETTLSTTIPLSTIS